MIDMINKGEGETISAYDNIYVAIMSINVLPGIGMHLNALG